MHFKSPRSIWTLLQLENQTLKVTRDIDEDGETQLLLSVARASVDRGHVHLTSSDCHIGLYFSCVFGTPDLPMNMKRLWECKWPVKKQKAVSVPWWRKFPALETRRDLARVSSRKSRLWDRYWNNKASHLLFCPFPQATARLFLLWKPKVFIPSVKFVIVLILTSFLLWFCVTALSWFCALAILEAIYYFALQNMTS